MLLLIFAVITVIYYFIQRDKIRRSEKREDFRIRQEDKLAELLENARKEDRKQYDNNDK
nr:hypothetical protein [uncultured Chryseobacterium sp.]